jgi:hypothetical protein
MLSILLDSKRSPEHFSWFGAIELSSIKEWATNSRWEFPEDLLDFWSQTGGGDCFESETFFRPTDQPSNAPYFIEGDDFRSANDHRLKNGMPSVYLAFQDGSQLSAIRRSDQTYVVLNEKYEVKEVFADFNEWYERTLRTEFAERHGLPSLD